MTPDRPARFGLDVLKSFSDAGARLRGDEPPTALRASTLMS